MNGIYPMKTKLIELTLKLSKPTTFSLLAVSDVYRSLFIQQNKNYKKIYIPKTVLRNKLNQKNVKH